jgi:3-isopropylmalate/(R)-2-methylmalate dehydratase small subunit
MQRFELLTSKVMSLPLDNVNTDQIIPARFLKRTETNGWGSDLFADWKRDPRFVINNPRLSGAAILLAGSNFGCGSSREHAAWALRDFGFRAVVGPSFADIFRENATKNGLLAAQISPAAYSELVSRLSLSPTEAWTVDLGAQRLTAEGMEIPFEIDPFAKTCLQQGLDELAYILEHEYAITAHEVFTSF